MVLSIFLSPFPKDLSEGNNIIYVFRSAINRHLLAFVGMVWITQLQINTRLKRDDAYRKQTYTQPCLDFDIKWYIQWAEICINLISRTLY